ncbi:Disease resistance protein [Corchorus olitorius]|uniref:Disease resistance protein n=1 Tax=Corchorus olitorius TaxID=93759 RepID=A0A1R3KH75_9ROSI|nr:Disease resistance protein [Corchorus olitorius]
MADSVASPLLQSLIDRLDSCCLSFGAGDEMLTRLRSVLAAVKNVAAMAEQRFEVAEHIKRWLTEVKGAAYELEFLLDDYEQQIRQVRNRKFMSSCFCFFTKNKIRYPIEGALRKLTRLASEGDWPLETNWQSDLYARMYSGTRFVGLEPEIVGRDRERDEIIDILFSGSKHVFQFLPILGVGGVGKTALARLVYNHERVTRNFRFKYWVSLGNNLDVDLQRIGEVICSRKFSSMNDLEDGVTQELMGKKFLVVLDNLCHEESDLGIILKEWFSGASVGSAVIVTTHSTAAADSVSALQPPIPFYLQPLRDADCLEMFRKVAFLPGEEMEGRQIIELSEISKILVANCRGLPLAVKILGALLPYNGDMDDWLAAAALALLELQNSTTCSVMGIGGFKFKSPDPELRYCSLICESERATPLRYLSKTENLQTLLLLSGNFVDIPDTIFSRLGHLRVLDFSQSGIHELPASFGALKHMRYLDLSRTYIRKIPESIGNLKYLKTLELSHCYNLEQLPETAPQLTKLVNLGVLSCCSLTYFPSGIGKLKLLKKLPIFVLGKRSDCATLNELSGLDLMEKLEIKNLENVTNDADARDAKLSEKVSLHSLELSWGRNGHMNPQMSAKILEYLSPPENLTEFCLKGYKGSWFPSWMNQGLPNLLKISLINCSCQKLPPLGQLPFLKVLHLKGMSEVRTIGHEFYGNGVISGFPCLEQLEIHNMPNLEGWKSIQNEKIEIIAVVDRSSGPLPQIAFPRLDKLVIEGCHRLTALPIIPSLRSLALCDSNEMLLCSVVHLQLLSSLVIEKLTELEPLTGYFKSFCSIEKLTVYDCDHLDYLFEGNQALASLKCLSILYCNRLVSLPLGLRWLTSLEKFDVMECEQLKDISVLQSLHSLEELYIDSCPMLTSLPSGVDNLTNLQRWLIKGCPGLQRELERIARIGSKMAHIPDLEIESL